MPDDYLEDGGQLKGPVKPLKKKHKVLAGLFRVLCVAIFAVGVASVANFLYLRINFGDSFFVNGLSMYPTLNKNGSRLENGSYRPLRWNDGGNKIDDIIDYGWGRTDEGKGWRNDLKRYDLVITYYPSDYKNEAKTELIGHDLTSDYVRRLTRRKKTKTDHVVDVTTADGFVLRLKTMSIADRRIQASQEEGMRAAIKDYLTSYAAENKLADVIKAIISGDMSKDTAKACHQIIPIKRIEIRKSEILARGEGEPESIIEAEAPAEEPAAEETVEAPAEEPAEAPAEEKTE